MARASFVYNFGQSPSTLRAFRPVTQKLFQPVEGEHNAAEDHRT
jgi:hypothetical protein